MCFAFRIDEEKFTDPEYPPNIVDPEVARKREEKEEQEKIVAFIKKRYSGRAKLPENLHFSGILSMKIKPLDCASTSTMFEV